MENRTKRLIWMSALNMAIFTVCIFVLIGFMMVVAIISQLVVSIWGTLAGLAFFGVTLTLIGLLIISVMKAKDDLRVAEARERQIMDSLRTDTPRFGRRIGGPRTPK